MTACFSRVSVASFSKTCRGKMKKSEKRLDRLGIVVGDLSLL
ncbi:hypothetical protein SAMN02745220_04670 [Desulfopila aestuarii DSM 18488]|uniref:Uncharacterized protein n=1 Tax=Desulfopila aestuarii DSM 18488 TaxID=1121416 RepID=A0A1M7YJ64_9BACT|nr:hypothetical protein SAMN02745220_04670 [Desulfopila aestuarii DSM 18488]